MAKNRAKMGPGGKTPAVEKAVERKQGWLSRALAGARAGVERRRAGAERREIAKRIWDCKKNLGAGGKNFLKSGLDAAFLRESGFGAKALRKEFGLSAKLLHALGFTLPELLWDAGFSIYSVAQADFKAMDFRNAGIRPEQLLFLGIPKLLDIGFSRKELVKAGVPETLIGQVMGSRRPRGPGIIRFSARSA